MSPIEDLITNIDRLCFKDRFKKTKLKRDLINVKSLSEFEKILTSLEENPELLDIFFEMTVYTKDSTPLPKTVFDNLTGKAQDIESFI